MLNFTPPINPNSGDLEGLSSSSCSLTLRSSPKTPWECNSPNGLAEIMERVLGNKTSNYYLNSPLKALLLEEIKTDYSTLEIDLEDRKNLSLIHVCFRLLEPAFAAICARGDTGFASNKGIVRGPVPTICEKNGYMGVGNKKSFSIKVDEKGVNYICEMFLSEGTNDRFHLKVRDFIAKKNDKGILEFWSDHYNLCIALPFSPHQIIPMEPHIAEACSRERLSKYYTKGEIEQFDSEDSKFLARASNGTYVGTVLSLKSLRTREELVRRTQNTRPSYLFMEFVRGVLISALYAMNPEGDLLNTHPARRLI